MYLIVPLFFGVNNADNTRELKLLCEDKRLDVVDIGGLIRFSIFDGVSISFVSELEVGGPLLTLDNIENDATIIIYVPMHDLTVLLPFSRCLGNVHDSQIGRARVPKASRSG